MTTKKKSVILCLINNLCHTKTIYSKEALSCASFFIAKKGVSLCNKLTDIGWMKITIGGTVIFTQRNRPKNIAALSLAARTARTASTASTAGTARTVICALHLLVAANVRTVLDVEIVQTAGTAGTVKTTRIAQNAKIERK